MKNLNDILTTLKVDRVVGETDVQIADVQFDSRKISDESLFVAVRGTVSDGHSFIASAIEKGAKVIVCEEMPTDVADGITYIKVQNTSRALGQIASAWYGFPSSSLRLVGVTGTNGKTTIATLLYKLFTRMGYKCGLLSTVCNYVVERAIPATHTTEDALTINHLLSEMVDEGCTFAFMEVSSHAVDQHRIEGLVFEGGIFTNLTRDHLDYHKTLANYLNAKKAFFDSLSEEAFALTNLDDKNGMVMLQNTKAKKLGYSLTTLTDFKTTILEDSFDGMKLQMNGKEVFVPFIGRFNASNLTAVFGAAVSLGFDEEEVLVNLSAQTPVSGRFEPITAPSGAKFIVDYAHTPDALENVISTINEIRCGRGRLITVVGCGGNRDKGKRPMMAHEAVKGSTHVILTSDNPRCEDPNDILNDMLEGVKPDEKAKVVTIPDRRSAIQTAAIMAQPDDVILIAGKGHEDYQEINGVKHHFDDKEVVREVMR